jgi:hypothetical protein
MKKISSVSFWLFIFFALIAIQTYSTFGQSMSVRNTSMRPAEKIRNVQQPSSVDCLTTFTQRSGGLYVVEKSTVFLTPLRANWIAGNSCIDNRSTILIP